MSTPNAFDPVAHARAMRMAGLWSDKTIDHYIAAAIAATPDKPALVAYRADRGDGAEPRRFSYRELGDLVARAAAALRRLGVGRGDVVAVQVPNWWEFAVAALAARRIGAVVNPLMPIFREREMSYMLGFAEAKVLVVPKLFRGFDHAAMARSLLKECPKLRHVIVIDEPGADGFEERLLSGNARVDASESEEPAPAADDLAVIMFTSGTTGSPKGVMHDANRLVACNNSLAQRFGLTANDVLLGCSPLGHMTGYAAVLLLGLRLGGTVVLQDVWESRQGVTIMARERVTYTAASTPFLTDICEAVAAGAPRPAQLRSFLCGGAPIPPVLIERAARELDLKVCSLWGMTESLSSTLTEPARAHDKSATSDGRPLPGVDVRIVDELGAALPAGQTGRLLVRGAQMFIGYYKRPDIATFDAEGWFDTGDLAYADDEGYIRINGRSKDVLIRGGENVPVVEIEALLYKHPAVLEASLVGYPDARLGERGCACVVLRPGASLDLPAVQAYVAECRVAKQYWPERVLALEALPRTPSGKIQKFLLREIAAAPPR
jgi:cyclohexanecarboxylate-CoA ligase